MDFVAAIAVVAGQLVMDLGVCEAAQWCCCSGGDVYPSWSSSIFFCEGRKTVDKRAWKGKRGWSGGEEQSSGQGPWEKRQGPEGARKKRRGGVDPTISPSPEFPGSARLDFLGGGRLLSRPIDSGPNANNATSLADFFPFRRQRHHTWKLELRRDKIAMLSHNHLYCTSQVPKLAEANISHGSYPHLEVCRVALSIEAAQHM